MSTAPHRAPTRLHLPAAGGPLRRGDPSLAALAPTAEERAWWRRARVRHALPMVLPLALVLATSGVGARLIDHGAHAFAGARGLRLLALLTLFPLVAAVVQWKFLERSVFARHLAGRRLRQALDAELAGGPAGDPAGPPDVAPPAAG